MSLGTTVMGKVMFLLIKASPGNPESVLDNEATVQADFILLHSTTGDPRS